MAERGASPGTGTEISRARYAALYGPTTGDRVRLADTDLRDGRIVALGKAGNPDTMDGVTPTLVIGPSTEVIAGNGLILTAGGIDSHVHLIAPQQIPVALGAGMTTLIGGGTGPAEGTKATTVTPGAFWLDVMLRAATAWPVNLVLLGKGNTVSAEGLWEQTVL